jgi:outer membrane beta-barrel protein
MRVPILPSLSSEAPGLWPRVDGAAAFMRVEARPFPFRPASQGRTRSTCRTSRAENAKGYDSSVAGLVAPLHPAAARRRLRSFWSPLALVALGASLWTHTASAQCVDEALKQQLVGERAYRGVVPRKFQKALRHELSALGGWFAGDLSDGAPVYGGAYTFHFTEDLGLEASYLRSRQRYSLLDALNERQPLVDLVETEDNPLQFFSGNVVWSLAYGKVRWLGGAIGRYDFYVSLGGGATVEPGDVGLTGSGGFGMKFYLTQWLALRLDVRDFVHEQKRVALGVEKIVNDITATGGLSVFIPFTN